MYIIDDELNTAFLADHLRKNVRCVFDTFSLSSKERCLRLIISDTLQQHLICFTTLLPWWANICILPGS